MENQEFLFALVGVALMIWAYVLYQRVMRDVRKYRKDIASMDAEYSRMQHSLRMNEEFVKRGKYHYQYHNFHIRRTDGGTWVFMEEGYILQDELRFGDAPGKKDFAFFKSEADSIIEGNGAN